MASTSIDATALFVRTLADVAIQNEKYFADLDGVCGDGDFGISLATGFSKVMEQWDAIDRSTPGALLKSVVDDDCQQRRRRVGCDLGDGVPARERSSRDKDRPQRSGRGGDGPGRH